MSIAGFTSLQSAENRLVPAALGDAHPSWLLELSPLTGTSPGVPVERTRLAFNAEGICFPLRARLDQWPLDDESVPAMLVRHIWQPGVQFDPMEEILRVLKPGGTLISVSANPWHRLAWRELGRDCLHLPSWPHLQLIHARYPLQLSVPTVSQWRGLVPGLTPVLILVARKPQRPARIKPLRFQKPNIGRAAVPAAQCRAA